MLASFRSSEMRQGLWPLCLVGAAGSSCGGHAPVRFGGNLNAVASRLLTVASESESMVCGWLLRDGGLHPGWWAGLYGEGKHFHKAESLPLLTFQ